MIADPVRCLEFVELVTEWLEGALTEERRAEVEEHLAICPHCVHYLDQMRATSRLLATLDDGVLAGPVSGDSHERLLRAFRGWTR